ARYLKNGGRVIIVLSIATTAYTLLTAPPSELERVLYEEAGALGGGFAGSSVAVGICLLFGVVSGGWGMLACGVIGGVGGGMVGTLAGNRLYYSHNSKVESSVEMTGILDANELMSVMPPQMCVAQ